MNPLILPSLVALAGGGLAVAAVSVDEADIARRIAVVTLGLTAIVGLLVAIASAPTTTWASLAASPFGACGGSLAALGAALSLSQARASGARDVTAPLACVAVAGTFLALESSWIVPFLLYLSVPIAAIWVARRARPGTLAIIGGAAFVLALGLGAARHRMSGWALPWLEVVSSNATFGATLALAGALGLVAAGCLLGATRDGSGDRGGAALGWTLIAAGTVVAGSLGPVAARGVQGGAPPGAIFLLALSAATGLAGREAAPFSAACLVAGVSLAPGCGPGCALLVGLGAFAAVLLNSTGAEWLHRYARWCRSGLPGGALFPGVSAAALAVVRSPAPGAARAIVILFLGGASLLTLMTSSAPVMTRHMSSLLIGAAVATGAAWLALFPAPWSSGLAGPAARATFSATPAADVGIGRVVAVCAVASAAVGFVLSAIGARAPVRVSDPDTATPPVPVWRRRLARALPPVPRVPVPLTWVSMGAAALYAFVALRLLQVGARAGFL
jgi:hypothetical protein